MTTRLALANLRHYKARTAVALAGIAFADLLVFMQLGFLGAVAKTATIVYDALDFDIALRSPTYLHLSEPGFIPSARLQQAESLSHIKRARPIWIGINEWQNPRIGEFRGIMEIGIDPLDPPFRSDEMRRKCRRLSQSSYILIDTETQKDYGPQDDKKFGDADVGTSTMLGRARVQIVGHFSLGTGLAANGAVLQSGEGFFRCWPPIRRDSVSMGLLRVAAGHTPAEAKQALQSLIAADGSTQVLTRQEVLDRELARWVDNTSLGTIFQLGVAVALLVGVAIVYQVLSTDVARMMPEYATLNAMGYSNQFPFAVIMQQAAAIGVLGYLPGVLGALVCYRASSIAANIPVHMTSQRLAGVFTLSVVMCTLSGLLAANKLRNADPADLY